MAAGLDSGGDELDEAHEINVTPFIDVMLVLLIIFMVAAPLATVDVPVDLPSANAPAQPRPNKPLWLTVRDDLSLRLGNEAVARTQLIGALDAMQQPTGEGKERVFIRADRSLAYGDVMEVMNLLRAGGYTDIALVGLDAVPADAPAPP
jgi:biopolymer transport protein ExbD